MLKNFLKYDIFLFFKYTGNNSMFIEDSESPVGLSPNTG